MQKNQIEDQYFYVCNIIFYVTPQWNDRIAVGTLLSLISGTLPLAPEVVDSIPTTRVFLCDEHEYFQVSVCFSIYCIYVYLSGVVGE